MAYRQGSRNRFRYSPGAGARHFTAKPCRNDPKQFEVINAAGQPAATSFDTLAEAQAWIDGQ